VQELASAHPKEESQLALAFQSFCAPGLKNLELRSPAPRDKSTVIAGAFAEERRVCQPSPPILSKAEGPSGRTLA
jgi:hypothetical protein